MEHLTQSLLQVPRDVATLHYQLCILMVVASVASFIVLLFVTAPYGRYSRPGWGFMINARWAWLTQETPSLLVTAGICWSAGVESFSDHPTSLRTVLTTLFLTHYVYRSLIYPLRIQPGKTTSLTVWASSFVFCVWNGFLQGYMLAYQLSPTAPITTASALGLGLEVFGMLNVIYCDHLLITLRKPGQTGYQIPQGGMFNLVSAGNYCSEILEWTGYALASGSLAGAAFATMTWCNLAPRGVRHHEFYLQKFENYPKSRKAVIPFVW